MIARSLLLALSLSLSVAPLGAQGNSPEQHERQAQIDLRNHLPEAARKEFEAVVAADPNNLNAQANLGVLLYFSGDFKAAEPHLRAALAITPRPAKLQALLGSCERRNGEFTAAREDLAAALQSLDDPKIRKQAGLELVELDTAANDLPAAAAAIAQLKAALPADPEVLYAAYRVYTDLAGESLLDLSLAAPNSAQFHQAMAHEAIHNRDNAAAILNMRQALALSPHLPGGHFELAEMLANSEHPEDKAQAKHEYELAVADQPSDPASLTRIGDLLGDSGDHAAAIAHYQQALTAQPNFIDAQIGLAYQYTEAGKPDQALPLLQAALQEDPTSVLAHYRLSAVYRRLHRPEDAKREIAQYESLKALKDKLRTVYQDARSDAPQGSHAKP